MTPRLTALGDDEIGPRLGVLDGMFDGASQRRDGDVLGVRTIEEVLRRRSQCRCHQAG